MPKTNETRLNLELDGLSRNALEGTYEVNLIRTLCLEAKLNRIKKELAITACAIEDGAEMGPEQYANGLKNVIAYIEAKNKLPDELDLDLGSIELVNKHLAAVKKYEEDRIKMMKSKK